MNVEMLGIDHSAASVTYRELFSFTKKECGEALEEFVKVDGVLGCVIISTCNRMEIWISFEEGFEVSIYQKLCQLKGVDSSKYHNFFISRKGMEAVDHLYNLTCGMKSKIMGEDQIITQVKDALKMAREHYCTDNVLEVLFRMAITSAKKVKTNVHFSTANYSAINEAIKMAKKHKFVFKDAKCLVIGNGEMGKLAAKAMRDEGAKVTVTVRQYKSGVVMIPDGCERINYGDRMEYLPECDFVVSATASPNTTIKLEELEKSGTGNVKMMIDLAVPRDIDPRIKGLNGIRLYNIDSFKVDLQTDAMKEQLEEVNMILQKEIQEFVSWYECRDIIPVVQSLGKMAGKDVFLRIEKPIKKLELTEKENEIIKENVLKASAKVINKIMFEIRDNVSIETFRECSQAIEKMYKEEEI
ncbi:glutamyl-tRNA reductase [Acetitomaculum ruminis DSM 5522]|uniref:Glutamyl-tRNA reductase n=1 Tax=Acetitomaculum ruminis DSM 5522 TaxID=1120918 RepID=A0A1I0YXP4_9FIRM|nr:glutamyl-tRNA reductase [Acetitomaculum ruminis]SFB18179.1 glutamyl-tRNA reductase [Acetitomaculum ruminis DSM 5522]